MAKFGSRGPEEERAGREFEESFDQNERDVQQVWLEQYNRSELEKSLTDCALKLCEPLRAKSEALRARFGIGENYEEVACTENEQSEFISDPQQLIADKTITMGETVAMTAYGDCFAKCSDPLLQAKVMQEKNKLVINQAL